MIKTHNEFNLYMLLLLLKQSYEWAGTIDRNHVHHDMKYDLNLFLNSGTKFLKTLEKEFAKQGEHINDIYWEQSEVISKFFAYLKNADIAQKNEMIDVLTAYMNGELKINYVDQPT